MNKAYKVMNPDMTCRGMKYEVGQTYKHNGKIELCEQGFHFCMKATDCFNYYNFSSENIVCEIEFGENVKHGEDKSVTDQFTVIRQIPWLEVLIYFLIAVIGSSFWIATQITQLVK